MKDGDEFKFGSLILTARHTPGHTPEHVSYVAAEEDHPETPWGVFTGDSLFVSSAGRPDLLGRDADKLASQLYDTLWDFYAKLPDGVKAPVMTPLTSSTGDLLTIGLTSDQLTPMQLRTIADWAIAPR